MPNKGLTLGEWYQQTHLPASEKRGFLRHFLGLNQIQTMTRTDLVLTESQMEDLSQAVQRRLSGEPFPYIVGYQEFFSRTFLVNPTVLIPRPDTECLIEWVIENTPQQAKVVDLGTGSGCIAITLKLERPDLEVIATDISKEALSTAQENAKRLGAQIIFYLGCWLDALPKDEQIDVIVSNPPYIEKNDDHLRQLTFEPLSALTDHCSGLGCINSILEEASAFPSVTLIAIEHGWNQGASVRSLAKEKGFQGARTFRDYGNNDRFTVWQKVS